jgi:serine/threonine protein kinase
LSGVEESFLSRANRDSSGFMDESSTTATDADTFHREHPYMLPLDGDVIISPTSGISYCIGENFAQGGFSHVFACSDDWEHSLVAKVLKPLGAWQDTQAKAISEVVAQSVVRSPHIVQVLDTFIYKGAYYLVSERCAFTLREMIGDGSMTPSVWFPSLAKAVLHALHFMHTHGLGHCDVHAGNVFLHFIPNVLVPEEAAYIFKLGDFGLTRPIEAMSPGGTFQEYITPPEAIWPDAFGVIDHRADLYQAGMLFLGFLRGEECRFDAQEIRTGRPRELAEALQHPSAALIAKLLRRHPEARLPRPWMHGLN